MLYLHNLLYNNEDHAVNDHIFGDMGAYISSKIHWLDRWPPCGNFNKKDHLLHQNVKRFDAAAAVHVGLQTIVCIVYGKSFRVRWVS
jgi:hypothetical protein